MGGGVALRFAHDFPEQTASMTLIGSVGPIVERSEVGEAIDRGENPLLTRGPDDLNRLLRLVAERLPPSTRAMRRYLGTERWKRAPALAELFEGWVDPAAGDGVPTALGALDAPALVIHGGKDRVIHPSTGKALAEGLARAKHVPMASLGHVPQLEDPRGVAKELEGFLASLP
jgi:pimeloyl-ACP methyl ester carboxylesterase